MHRRARARARVTARHALALVEESASLHCNSLHTPEVLIMVRPITQSPWWPVAFLVSIGIACSTAPKTEGGKSELESHAASALAKAEAVDPTLSPLLRTMKGHAVFPEVKKGGVVAGGAYGKGVLYENGAVVGYCDVSQQSIGAQIGGQTYTEIIALQTPEALRRFKEGSMSFDATTSAVAMNAGSSASAKFKDGVAVFTTDEKGLMAEASIGGQEISYQPKGM